MQHRPDQVTVEFGGNPPAMADEIPRLRYGLARLAEAINWMKLGAPFIMMPPGPYWKSKPEEADDHS